eukprot:751471-Hanusia_phi.AAC.1
MAALLRQQAPKRALLYDSSWSPPAPGPWAGSAGVTALQPRGLRRVEVGKKGGRGRKGHPFTGVLKIKGGSGGTRLCTAGAGHRSFIRSVYPSSDCPQCHSAHRVGQLTTGRDWCRKDPPVCFTFFWIGCRFA